jgi:hypothetical protein
LRRIYLLGVSDEAKRMHVDHRLAQYEMQLESAEEA